MINNIIKRDREKKCYMDYVIILFTILVYKTKARISVQREKNSKVACTKPVDMPSLGLKFGWDRAKTPPSYCLKSSTVLFNMEY